MHGVVSVSVSPGDHRQLEAIVADRKCAWKHVWRARSIVRAADGLGRAAIMRKADVSKTCVWRRPGAVQGEGTSTVCAATGPARRARCVCLRRGPAS